MKAIKKLLQKLILSILTDEDGFITINSFVHITKSTYLDGSVIAGGSIQAQGDIASYTQIDNNEEDKK